MNLRPLHLVLEELRFHHSQLQLTDSLTIASLHLYRSRIVYGLSFSRSRDGGRRAVSLLALKPSEAARESWGKVEHSR